jgi:hypothetical protein
MTPDSLLNTTISDGTIEFSGNPFNGVDVSEIGRQIVGDEVFIPVFDFATDRYLVNASDFGIVGDVNFVALDANAPDVEIPARANVIILLNSDNDGDPTTPFLAGTAANQIAELVTEDGAGLFVYFNSNLQLNRLVYSANLNDASADLKILSRQTDLLGQDAIDALANFSAENFAFEDELVADNILIGDDSSNVLIGGNEQDFINGRGGDDVIEGRGSSDILMGDAGADTFGFSGDPFEGADVSAEGRQIIGNEDFISDFDFTEDQYRLNASDFKVVGEVNFVALDANDPEAEIPEGANVITLLNSDNDGVPTTPFLAGTAANQIAELVTEDGAGFFVYFNSNLQLNRLVYSTNLNDASADLKILARQTDLTGQDAIDALANFSADNFVLDVNELIDLTGFDGLVEVGLTLTREAAFDNILKFYATDATGRVGNLLPGDAGYEDAVRASLLNSELFVSNLSTEDVTLNLVGGTFYAPALLIDGDIHNLATIDDAITGISRIQRDDTIWRFEDLTDGDFNDFVLTLNSVVEV